MGVAPGRSCPWTGAANQTTRVLCDGYYSTAPYRCAFRRFIRRSGPVLELSPSYVFTAFWSRKDPVLTDTGSALPLSDAQTSRGACRASVRGYREEGIYGYDRGCRHRENHARSKTPSVNSDNLRSVQRDCKSSGQP